MSQIDEIIKYIETRRDKIVMEMGYCREHNYELQIHLLRAIEKELTDLRFEILYGELKKINKEEKRNNTK